MALDRLALAVLRANLSPALKVDSWVLSGTGTSHLQFMVRASRAGHGDGYVLDTLADVAGHY